MKTNTYILSDIVARLLVANPEGLSTYELFNQLADSELKTRWLPTRNSFGPKLRAIGGINKQGTATGYSTAGPRTVVVWSIDIEAYNEWRGANVFGA